MNFLKSSVKQQNFLRLSLKKASVMGYVSLAITAFIVLLRLIYRKLKKKLY